MRFIFTVAILLFAGVSDVLAQATTNALGASGARERCEAGEPVQLLHHPRRHPRMQHCLAPGRFAHGVGQIA